jgi:hypothetical protein
VPCQKTGYPDPRQHFCTQRPGSAASLAHIGMGLVAGAQVFAPPVLAFSVYGVDDAAPSSGATERGDGQECSALSAIQVAPLAAWHQMMNSTCAYNLTIGPDGVAVH